MLKPNHRFHLIALVAFVGLLSCLVLSLSETQAADDAGWEEVLKIEGVAGFGNEVVTKTFQLSSAKKIKIKWDLRPTGNTPLFRATLGMYRDNLQKYVNSGVIVRAGGASKKEQAGKLPAGKHRVVFTMKRMKYNFTILVQK